ncbi:MAG: toll/interleukin-1 receptor domain-containing protein, partial [Planctomycetes bacterium]|nr:toll/interleukin-1 receptor domain-containing protein [Planctomycetota bacterium]
MIEPSSAERADLFVSYAHADDRDGWIEGLVEALQQAYTRLRPAPLALFFDRQAIQSMQDWEDRILLGLREAKSMLAVLSPAYFQSAFCRREWKTFQEHERSLPLPHEGIAPVSILPAPDFDDHDENGPWLADVRRRQYVDLRPFYAAGLGGLSDETFRQEVDRLIRRISDRVSDVERYRASPSTIPPYNPNFVGRTDELRKLHDTLALGRVGAVTAVQGIGGIGKTALAYHYAHRYAAEYPGGRFLISAAGAIDLRIPIIKLAPHRGVALTEADDRDPDLAFPKVQAALQNGPRTLLVVDNLDDPGLVTPEQRGRCLPVGEAVHVLFTTRLDPRKMRGIECLPLDTLPERNALELLANHRPIPDEAERVAARRIVGRLAGHALAVEVVAVYLGQYADISYTDYLARLEAEGIGAVDRTGDDELVNLSVNPETLISRLLEPTLAGLPDPEILTLEYASLLPPDAIPLPWLRALVGGKFSELLEEPKPGYPDPWDDLVLRLAGLRLLTPGDDPRIAQMHPIAHHVVRTRISDAARQTALIRHAEGRADLLREAWIHHENRWEIEPLHRSATLSLEAETVEAADLAGQVGKPLWELGRLAECRDLLRDALSVERDALDPDAPRLAVSYSNLALVENDLGNSAEARDLLRRAIALAETAVA